MIASSFEHGIEVLQLSGKELDLKIVPALGGKMISLINKKLQQEFLWTNSNLPLAINNIGDEYDPNFLGGIDELIPNDIPETIDSIAYPDHGELWTTRLQHHIKEESITVHGTLELSQLFYSKTIRLDDDGPMVHINYLIRNDSPETRHFLWKLHAALKIEEGSRLVTGATLGAVVDPAYSRFSQTQPFGWPRIEETDASVVPPKNGSMDFFYLYGNQPAEMQMLSANKNALFAYRYDSSVFPYQWYFASYGGFLDHYTAILEPCTTMPISMNEAAALQQCTVLQPGEELTTTVTIFAGKPQDFTPTI